MDDIEEIKCLKARYFRTLDSKDWTGLRAVFTADFVSDSTGSGGKVITGADEFIAFLEKALGSATTVHHGHMPEIELTSPESAKGVWAMEDVVRFPGLIDLRGYGHYHEQYRKVDGRWLISHSRLTRLRMDFRWLVFSFKLPQRHIRKWSTA